MPERNVFSWNAIIFAHIHNHDMVLARHFFDSAPIKDSTTYNSMISGYANSPGLEHQAVQLFSVMQETGTRLDEFTLTTMLNLSAKESSLVYGKQLHSYVVKTENGSNPFMLSALIDMYSKCGCFSDSLRVYRGSGGAMDVVSKNSMVAACCREGDMEMASELFWRNFELNDRVSWNTLISGYAQNGYWRKALETFRLMEENRVRWNEHTFTSLLSACSSLRSHKHGKEVHAWVVATGLSSNPYISSGLVDMYCKCDNITYAELVNASSDSENVFSASSLILAHSFKGNMVEARKLFDSLYEKNLIVWTALFSGYVRSRQCKAVFDLFMEFNKEQIQVPDALILVSVLGACAIQAALQPGKQIHTYIQRMGIELEDKLASSLVDMYAKCGEINYAENMFRQAHCRDRVMYNAMMAGYAHNGYEQEAIGLFEEMLENKIKPDVVTFIALLSACRHAGLVEAGEKYFASMTDNYGIIPEIDHYSCMVDLYGRTNCLDKAEELMKNIPLELDAVIWGAFLNACKMNGNAKLLKEAEEMLLRTEAENGARYVQLAQVYAAEENWSEMCRIRGRMREGVVKKLAGCSWVYLENRTNIFISGDRSHSQAEAIYYMLNSLNAEMVKMNKTRG
ncbi:hypothetical protein ACHQM5_007825 [Ranunculus cassubicifolius]